MKGNGAIETNDLWRKKTQKLSHLLTLDSTFIDASQEEGVIDAAITQQCIALLRIDLTNAATDTLI